MISPIFGIIAILALAFVFSESRRSVNWRIIASAFAMQAGIAAFVLYIPVGKDILASAAAAAQTIINYADDGIVFVFGDLGTDKYGFFFAVRILPVIVFVSSLMAALYYLGIMQFVVSILGGAMQRIIGTSRVESLCAAANIFVGPIEAPLTVQPYIKGLSRARLFTIMATGLSSVSGAILLGYASIGIRLDYLVAAAFMAAPGGLLMAKILIPETEDEPAESEVLKVDHYPEGKRPVNVIEAAADGAVSGVMLALNIGGILIAFIAIISLLNGILSGIGGWVGLENLTLELILGLIFSPLMILLGMPWEEALTAGNLVGQKTFLNEFVAFAEFVVIKDTLSEQTQAVITFALCGFANLNALAIVFGGLGGLVPERKPEIAQLGVKAILAGGLSNLMSAALAGTFLSL